MIQGKIDETGTFSPATTQEERFIVVIPDAYRGKGFGGKEQFNIIITGARVTFALIKPEGGYSRSEKYATKPAEEILAENKRNFSIERPQIKSVKFTSGHSYTDCCRKLQGIDGELEITAPKARYHFYVPFRRNTIARDVLSRAKLISTDTGKTSPDNEPSSGSGSSSH